MASKYNVTLYVEDSYNGSIAVSDHDIPKVAKAILAIERAEMQMARLVSELDYNRYG